jgi:dienelactone hydrolase
MARLRVQFIHGLEGSPQGSKARALAAAFETITPAMDTSRFEACVALHAEAVRRFEPDVLVGSSFGGAVAVALLQREQWTGPTLLLAQAALRQGLHARLPSGARVWLVHARGDDVVPIADSRKLARTGTPGLVKLVEVDDDHALHDFVASGRLVETVRELADASAAEPAAQSMGRFERFLAPLYEEPTLWPVLFVLAAHAVLMGAVLLALGLRSHNFFAMAALAILLVMTADFAIRRVRARAFGRLGWSVVSLWVLSAISAVLATRFDLF